MLRLITAFLGVFLLMQSAFADQARPETSKYVQAYRGQEGAVVWLMRIGPREANEALVQVSHVDNDIDGRIFRCKVQITRDGEKSYTAEIKGNRLNWRALKKATVACIFLMSNPTGGSTITRNSLTGRVLTRNIS